MAEVISVSALNQYVKTLLDANDILFDLALRGEIANFVQNARSGHCYFSLRDAAASVKAVMFRSDARRLGFRPEEGMKVVVRCRATLYERDGAFQVYVNEMFPDGIGAAQLAFEQLKAKLEQEGLFAAEHKKSLPAYPKCIGIVTSKTGAALQDIRNVIGRRWPAAKLLLCPVSVQGFEAAQQVADAIREAHDAGIRTVMITGDHIDTAVAIAKQLGIVTDRSHAITGADLDRMSDEELDAHIEDYGVYARVQPEHKTRIVEAWKSRDQIVAMTGDGVNDAPSIKRADIGVGMGITGTDVTKNVADMVLADDNFATIIGACEEGRRIYDNIRKVIQFLLSANLAEVFSVFIATLIGFTIFQPVQLLWVNLVTDCFPALALGMEDAEGDIMKRKPRNAKDGVFAGHMGLDCVVQGLIITVLVLASFFVGVYFDMGYIHIADMIAGNADEEGVMMAFITLNMVEIFHCFNMRSRRASLFTMKKQNKWLWASAALALVLTVIVTVQPTLAEMFFGPVTLELKGVLAALGLAFLIIPLMEIYKAIMRAVEKE